MKAIPWSVVTVLVAVIASATVLVFVGKLDPNVLTALLSAVTGGGLLHLGGSAPGATP